MASVGVAVGASVTEERAVFTQLKPVRMCGADGPEDSVFEDVKPAVRLTNNAVKMAFITQRNTNILMAVRPKIFYGTEAFD